MLKITKNQIVSGQKVKVTDLNKKSKPYSTLSMAQESFKKAGYEDGDIITIDKVTGTSVEFTNPVGRKCSFWWSCFKSITELEEGGENLGEGNVEYVVFHDGKRLSTKKYKDMGKVKASLLSLMNYYDKLERMCQANLDTVPELRYLSAPEFLGSQHNFSKADFNKVEIYEWKNRKVGEKVDFDPSAYYDEVMLLIKVTSKFGSSAREVFKDVKDAGTHEYIVTFMHEDYRNTTLTYGPDYDSLKESTIIKTALTQSKLKGTKKKTKHGKTSVAIKDETDAIKLMKLLPQNSFFILNMQGDELVEQSEALIIQESRQRKIDQILS